MPAHDSTLRDSLHVKAHMQQILPTAAGFNNTWLIHAKKQRFHWTLKKRKGSAMLDCELEDYPSPFDFPTWYSDLRGTFLVMKKVMNWKKSEFRGVMESTIP